jgi:hypothetical protein
MPAGRDIPWVTCPGVAGPGFIREDPAFREHPVPPRDPDPPGGPYPPGYFPVPVAAVTGESPGFTGHARPFPGPGPGITMRANGSVMPTRPESASSPVPYLTCALFIDLSPPGIIVVAAGHHPDSLGLLLGIDDRGTGRGRLLLLGLSRGGLAW